MKWQRPTMWAGSLIAFLAIAIWQWDEYVRECELVRETVVNSADSVMNALVGGVQSHRRLGPFFSEQIQDVLEGLAHSKDVLAVALASEDGQSVLVSGNRELLTLAPPLEAGQFWTEGGFLLVRNFRLPAERAGQGGGRGMGVGPGWGRWRQGEAASDVASHPMTNLFAPESEVAALLLVDRQHADAICRRAAWTRAIITASGWLVAACVALAWRSTVRLADARGRAKLLETESRHYRDLSQAAAGLAHETRNPLGLIRGWTQRLADQGIDSPESRRQAQTVVEECDRLTARINQFLAFARPPEPNPISFDVSTLFTELKTLLEPDIEAKGLSIHYAKGKQRVVADREMLREALFNLLQNAIDFSPESAAIDLSLVDSDNGRMRIEVADRGPRVPDEIVENLFAPYFTTRPGGTGLGLAIVRRIAAAQGWEAGYSPHPQSGAVFWLNGIQRG